MNLPAESIAVLKGFGYSQREAEFLYIVAAHSGFFLQRQFTQFVDVAGRGPATYFIKRAIEKQHVREHLPERGTQKIYHLFSRTVYGAIGKDNSRHRRPGRYGMLEKAGVRLLTLDFILANPDRLYLEEENDKVDYFIRQQSLKAEILPVKVFPGAEGKETRRYFFENFPIFLTPTDASPVVNFTYIEDDIRSIQTFASFVDRYRPLFEALANRFKLIFVSNSAQSFQLARNAFARSLSPAEREREHQQLARFFWLKRWPRRSDSKNWPTRMLSNGSAESGAIPTRTTKRNSKHGSKQESCPNQTSTPCPLIQGNSLRHFWPYQPLCGSRPLRRQRPPNHPPNMPHRRGQHKALKTKELSSMTAHEPNSFEDRYCGERPHPPPNAACP
jgi:hypothetical protein